MNPIDSIKATGFYKGINNWLSATHFTKDRIPLKRTLAILFKQLAKDNLSQKGSAMAFSFLLSIFPTIIFLFTIIPYTPLPDAEGDFMDFLNNHLPPSLYNNVHETIEDIIMIPHGGLMSFGFLTALFSVTSGIRAMIEAFNACYSTTEKRGFFHLLLVSTGLALFLSAIFIIAIALSIGVRLYTSLLQADVLHNQPIFGDMLLLFKYITLFMLFYLAISFIYYTAPTIHDKWSFFSIGSLIASLTAILFTVGFFYYISIFNSYNKLYGSIGAFIGIMMWFYIFSMVLLFGFEVNASIHMARQEVKAKTV